MNELSDAVQVATLATALGCVLVGGVLYAFSAFVMRGLAALPGTGGAAAMQQVNVAALRPPVLVPLLATAVGCVAVAVADRSGLALAGAALYVVGTVGVTAAANVPRNEALARVDLGTPDAAAHWAAYLRGWVAWNHVRTATSLAAGALLAAAAT